MEKERQRLIKKDKNRQKKSRKKNKTHHEKAEAIPPPPRGFLQNQKLKKERKNEGALQQEK